MSDAAEDIVRRATAAFNAGRRDDAQKLCERGLGARRRLWGRTLDGPSRAASLRRRDQCAGDIDFRSLFEEPVSGGKNPVPNSTRQDINRERARDAHIGDE
jgi:hypothetical protein